jgi:hypothetical protein
MEKYAVYVLVNISLQEVYFGLSGDVNQAVDELPCEIRHWEFGEHSISNAVIVEEDLLYEKALEVIRDLQEKSMKNPQGKKILINCTAQQK